MTTSKKSTQKKKEEKTETQLIPETKTSLTLHQKLLKVKKTVSFLKKETQGNQYKFVSSSQVLLSLRDAMNENAILLEPHIVKTEFYQEPVFNNKKGQWFTEIWTKMIWIDADNPVDRIEILWYSQGVDFHEKGVGKALTYGEKYFLLKYFNIPTDKDDPDYHQDNGNSENNRKSKSEEERKPKKQPGDMDVQLKNFDKISTKEDLTKFRNSLDKFKWTSEQVKELKGLIVEAEKNFNAFDEALHDAVGKEPV